MFAHSNPKNPHGFKIIFPRSHLRPCRSIGNWLSNLGSTSLKEVLSISLRCICDYRAVGFCFSRGSVAGYVTE